MSGIYVHIPACNVRYLHASSLTVLGRTCARSGRVYLKYHVTLWWRHQSRTLLWRRYPENMLWGAGDTCVVTISSDSSSCVCLLQISIQLSLMVLIFIYIYIYIYICECLSEVNIQLWQCFIRYSYNTCISEF